MKSFTAGLSNAEVAFARRVEHAGLASYSQAVKTLKRANEGDEDAIATVAAWRKQLAQSATRSDTTTN